MEINYEIKNLTELDKNILIEALDLLKEKYEETKLYYPSINGQDEKRDLILHILKEIDIMKEKIEGTNKI